MPENDSRYIGGYCESDTWRIEPYNNWYATNNNWTITIDGEAIGSARVDNIAYKDWSDYRLKFGGRFKSNKFNVGDIVNYDDAFGVVREIKDDKIGVEFSIKPYCLIRREFSDLGGLVKSGIGIYLSERECKRSNNYTEAEIMEMPEKLKCLQIGTLLYSKHNGVGIIEDAIILNNSSVYYVVRYPVRHGMDNCCGLLKNHNGEFVNIDDVGGLYKVVSL